MVKAVQSTSRSEIAYKTLQAGADEVDDKLEFADEVAGVARSSVAFADYFKPVGEKASVALGHTRFIGIASGLFELPRFFTKIYEFFTAKKPIKKAKAAGESVMSASDLAGSAGDIADGLKSVGAVTEKAVSWTGPLGMALLPFQWISLGLSGYGLYKTGSGKHELDKYKVREPQDSLDLRAESVALALTKLYSEKGKVLEDRFAVDKSEKIREKIGALLPKLVSTNRALREAAVQQAEVLLEELKGKIDQNLTLDTLSTGLKVASVAVGIAALCVPPVTLIALAIGAATSLIGFGVYLYRRYKVSDKVQAFSAAR